MRRMIDPKQLGGGQQEEKKYYNHFITLTEGEVTCSFTITNSRPDPYTKVSDIYTYLNTSNNTVNISATGNYNHASNKGIISQICITTPLGLCTITFTQLEIEVVENVPTIKMTQMAGDIYFSSVYSDNVCEF